jgi:hypothetical protein
MKRGQGQVKAILYNLTGVNLYISQQPIMAGEISLNFSALELKPGIYLLYLTTEDGSTSLLKIYRH